MNFYFDFYSLFNFGIAVAYYAIPIELFYITSYIWKDVSVSFRLILIGFIVFILSCGTGHFLEAFDIDHSNLIIMHGFTFSASALLAVLMPYASSHVLHFIRAKKAIAHQLNEEAIRRDQLSKQLETTNAELEQFVYAASHDLKAPIRGINNLIAILERKLSGQLSEPDLYIMRQIVKEGSYANSLIEGLLDYSRISRAQFSIESIALDELLNEVFARLAESILLNNVQFRYRSALPAIVANRVQIAQVFENLISNAIKYRSDRPVVIEIWCEETDSHWIFAIHDNGIGIDPEYHEQIFEMFKRLHSRYEKEGTGIGLATVKKIAIQHSGSAWVESLGEGQGSTFKFSIRKWSEQYCETTIIS